MCCCCFRRYKRCRIQLPRCNMWKQVDLSTVKSTTQSCNTPPHRHSPAITKLTWSHSMEWKSEESRVDRATGALFVVAARQVNVAIEAITFDQTWFILAHVQMHPHPQLLFHFTCAVSLSFYCPFCFSLSSRCSRAFPKASLYPGLSVSSSE